MNTPKLFLNCSPIQPEIPLANQVRTALRNLIRDTGYTDEEFESLFCKILDSEVHGRRDAAEIINNWYASRNK
jgi:hypothetical protein